LTATRERAQNARFALTALPIVDLHIAMEKLRLGDIDGAIESAGTVGADVHETCLLRLRALLARARGDETGYRGFRDRYRALATSLGFEGQMKWAEAMS
jgi:adenylate cyclase